MDEIADDADEDIEETAEVALELADRADDAVEFAELIAKKAEVWILKRALLADVRAACDDSSAICKETMLDVARARELERLEIEAESILAAEEKAELHSGRTPGTAENGGTWGNGRAYLAPNVGRDVTVSGPVLVGSEPSCGKLARKLRWLSIRIFVFVTTFPIVSAERMIAGPLE